MSEEKTEFKDTIMGKITKGAIFEWGENDENNEWFVPSEEQADAILSEGGLEMGDHIIDYSSAEKAVNSKTYGSEEAAIKGIVELMKETNKIPEEEKASLEEQIKSEVYTKKSLSPELAQQIKETLDSRGKETAIIDILRGIHDNWVKDNGNKFDDPKRAKKLYQFVDLRLMSYGGDGATADLLFLKPILEGAGIEVDVEGKLKEEFERQQKDLMEAKDEKEDVENKKIEDCSGVRNYLRNLKERYKTIQGVETNKGNKDQEGKEVTEELKNPEILERMTEQVCGKLGIEYNREVSTSEIGEAIEGVTLENFNDAMNTMINSEKEQSTDEQTIDEQ